MVYLFLANGFEEVEALCPLDLLRRAGVEVTTVGIGTDNPCSSHGICVQADISEIMYRDNAPEMIILPGGMPGAENLDNSKTVNTAISCAVKRGAYIAAICAAPMVLGKRGLLEGRRATCFPGFEEYLTGAVIEQNVGVVKDQNFITGKGMGVALEFGLTLVECLKGKDKSESIRKSIQAV